MRSSRLFFLVVISLLLNGCLTHWVVDSDTRLQLNNRTTWQIASLRVVPADTSLPVYEWVPDTLLPGERGHVFSASFVGTFHFHLSVRDSLQGGDTLWRDRDLGDIRVDGGSFQWWISTAKGSLVIEQR